MYETGSDVALRAPKRHDLAALLALSNAHEREIGTIARQAFEELVAMSFRTRMTETADAFLVALVERAPKVAPNYRWFAERLEHFVYVDRVVVAQSARQRGLGRRLYRDLMEAAAGADFKFVCCEVNVDPPNPVSDAFHAALGFAEIGRAFLPHLGKTVRYLTRELEEGLRKTVPPSP
ncbi:MAG: GNAT family N-acetyltransferase [Rhizomicrobium sp.]